MAFDSKCGTSASVSCQPTVRAAIPGMTRSGRPRRQLALRNPLPVNGSGLARGTYEESSRTIQGQGRCAEIRGRARACPQGTPYTQGCALVRRATAAGMRKRFPPGEFPAMKKKYRARQTLGITLVGRWTLRAEVLHRRGCGLWVCRLSNRRPGRLRSGRIGLR